jgi:GWxTD domain-containing protein
MKRIHRLLYPKTAAGIWAPTIAGAVLIATGAIMLSAWQIETTDPSQKWLNEDVLNLISPKEKAAFEHLATDDERQHFVEQFWQRRNPIPGSTQNKFKEEHYRRIAFANEHFTYKAGHLPGWKTGRGRIYILYGPPDEIDSHPAGGPYERPAKEGGGVAITYPFEDWRYRLAVGKGNRDFEFIDPAGTGEFRLAPNFKDKYKK